MVSVLPPFSVRTFAVIVTHRPDIASLAAQLESLQAQVADIVIVNNGSFGAADAVLKDLVSLFSAEIIWNTHNLGVATALNQGIAHARSQGATHVLLMDQDSLPADDMVVRLQDAIVRLQQKEKVAAVGPVAEDLRNAEIAPFVRIGFPLNHKIAADSGQIVQCDFLITSGSLIPIEVLDAVGVMDEALFIDNVDLEWSFRAARAGYRLYGVGDARMGHRIGDEIQRLPLGASVVHSPVRLYYMMRNRVLLYRRSATPFLWTAQDLPRALLKLLRFSIWVQPRAANAGAMLQGLRDGLLGRTGAKPDNAS